MSGREASLPVYVGFLEGKPLDDRHSASSWRENATCNDCFKFWRETEGFNQGMWSQFCS